MAKYKNNTTKLIYIYKYPTRLFSNVTECFNFCVHDNYGSQNRDEWQTKPDFMNVDLTNEVWHWRKNGVPNCLARII